MASAHDGQNELLHKEEKGFCLAVNENKIIHNIKKYKLSMYRTKNIHGCRTSSGLH
jgi:hypothetical protein